MYKATVKLKFSKMDQENLYYKVEEWKEQSPQDNFHFRGYGQLAKEEMELDNENDELNVRYCWRFVFLYFQIKKFSLGLDK